MYLSRLRLDPLRHASRELRLSPYLLHQAVFRSFPDKAEGGPGRILYRLDIDRQGNINLIVQSEKAPDWNKANLLRECCLEPAECKSFLPKCQAGQKLYFRIRVNPAVKKQVEGKKNGHRLGLISEEDQLAWLKKKAEDAGFAVVSCQATPEGVMHAMKGGLDGKLGHFAVRFEGVLQVVDPEVFQAAVQKGIGPAKGFGFGLLSVAPLRS